jgi:hypothetical protein
VNSDAPGDNFTVLESNHEYFLTEDEDGFAIWSVRSDNMDPVLTFPLGEDGRDDAARALRHETRFARWSRGCTVVAVVSGATWILATLLALSMRLFGAEPAFPVLNRSGIPFTWAVMTWSQSIGSAADAIFIVAVGISVIVWLQRRFRREG